MMKRINNLHKWNVNESHNFYFWNRQSTCHYNAVLNLVFKKI
jgi:hypothetical protein